MHTLIAYNQIKHKQQIKKLIFICFVFIRKNKKVCFILEGIYALSLEKFVVKINPGVPRGWKETPEESEDHQNENPGVSKVEISRETPGFRVFEEPLAIPSAQLHCCNDKLPEETWLHLSFS